MKSVNDAMNDTFRDIPIAKEPCIPNCASAGAITHTKGCPNVGKWPPGMVEQRWPQERTEATLGESDVATLLLDVAANYDDQRVYQVCLKAHEEIERLRKELAFWKPDDEECSALLRGSNHE